MGRKSKAETAGAKSFPPQAQLHQRWLTVGVCFFLALAVWIVFGQTLHFEFINYDDPAFVRDNPHVLNGLTWEDVKWAFRLDQGDYWHPLTWLSLMLDVNLFGKGAGGMHLTNVLLHTTNSILLFLLLRRWSGALWRSALVAALFAVHPLRVESVAWVTERKDVLSTLFWMLALLAYTYYAGKVKTQSSKAKVFYGLVLLSFVLGLMSKAMLVMLPVVMLLLDYWPLERIRQLTFSELRSALPRLLVEKIPLFLLSVIFVALTYWGQHREAAAPTAEDLSPTLRMEDVFVAYARYLEKTFWPANLAIPYPHPAHWNWFEIIFSITLIAGLSVMAWQLRQRKPYLFVGWYWFVITLIPVIGLTKGWLQFMADRFTYVPLTGIFLLTVWGMADLCAGWRHRRQVLGACTVVILVALIACARVQTSYWRDSMTLWSHTLACTSDNAIAENNLADVQLQQDNWNEAIVHCKKALQINPNYAEADNNLGNVLHQKGDLEGAISCFQKALQIKPQSVEPYYNLGNVLFQQGKSDEAIAYYRKALQINPDYVEANINLGNALHQKGDLEGAISCFQKALQIQPGNAETYYNLGNVLLQEGKPDEAIVHYQKALQINPDYAKAHINLGNALLANGSVDEAIIHFQKALQIQPDNVEAHNNLGYVLFQNGSVDEAIIHFQKALQIQPDNVEAHNNLGYILLQKGSVDEAITHFQKALQIQPNNVEAHNNLIMAQKAAQTNHPPR